MSYTLKIRWTRHEWRDVGEDPTHANVEMPPDDEASSARIMSLVDETNLFIPAEEVRVHSFIPAGQRGFQMKHWGEREDSVGYHNYLCVEDDAEQGGRLVSVRGPDGDETWYVATHAWILGPDGGTIERVAP